MMMMLMDDYLKLIRAECECDSLRFAIMFIANCYAFDLFPLLPSLSHSRTVSVSLSLLHSAGNPMIFLIRNVPA